MSENTSARIHPLLATAAVSVIIASGVGVAAMAGWLPNSNGAAKSQIDPLAVSASQAGSSAVAPLPDKVASNAATSSQPVVPAQSNSLTASQAGTQIAAVSPSVAKPVCQECGVVESVQTIEHHPSSGSGVGAVAGALLGGVLGHQVGGGNGQKLATVAGAVGGGFAGNAIEKKAHTTISYDVRVRMENGQHKTVHLNNQPSWQAGDHVRLVHGELQAG